LKLGAILVPAVLIFAACGGGDDGGGEDGGGDDGGGGGDTVSAESYVSDLCGAMVDWQKTIQDETTALQGSLDPNADVAARTDAIGGYLDQMVSATTQLNEDVEAAGVPDVEGGEEIAQRFQTGFQEAETALEDAREQVESLPESPEEFKTATDQLGNTIQTSLGTIGNSMSDISQSDLNQAFTEDETCSQIQTGLAG
jgi:hypothetical protein